MPDALPLWPGRAPGALGDRAEDRPTLTPFPLDGGPRPCVIVFPGGGYGMRAEHERTPFARWFNALGLASAILDYRVAPYRHPVPLGDAQRAIRTVRARAREWRVDPARIAVIGFSAGGHLAASASTLFTGGDPSSPDPIERESSRPDAAILCYPVISFAAHRHHGSMVNLLGEDPPEDRRRALSLELQVRPDTPPTFLWHTADDEPVPVQNSLLYAAALREKRVPFALHVFPKGPHGLGLAERDPTVGAWRGLCERWLSDAGFLAR